MRVRGRSLDILVWDTLLLVLSLLLLNKGAQSANFVVLVLLEVKVILFTEAELKQVVIQRLFAHIDFSGGVFERVPYQVPLSQHSVVQSPPEAHFLDDFFNWSLLRAFAFVFPLALPKQSTWSVKIKRIQRTAIPQFSRSLGCDTQEGVEIVKHIAVLLTWESSPSSSAAAAYRPPRLAGALLSFAIRLLRVLTF